MYPMWSVKKINLPTKQSSGCWNWPTPPRVDTKSNRLSTFQPCKSTLWFLSGSSLRSCDAQGLPFLGWGLTKPCYYFNISLQAVFNAKTSTKFLPLFCSQSLCSSLTFQHRKIIFAITIQTISSPLSDFSLTSQSISVFSKWWRIGCRFYSVINNSLTFKKMIFTFPHKISLAILAPTPFTPKTMKPN